MTLLNIELIKEPWNWAAVFIISIFALALISLVSTPAE